jgi:hypothetical protein
VAKSGLPKLKVWRRWLNAMIKARPTEVPRDHTDEVRGRAMLNGFKGACRWAGQERGELVEDAARYSKDEAGRILFRWRRSLWAATPIRSRAGARAGGISTKGALQ